MLLLLLFCYRLVFKSPLVRGREHLWKSYAFSSDFFSKYFTSCVKHCLYDDILQFNPLSIVRPCVARPCQWGIIRLIAEKFCKPAHELRHCLGSVSNSALEKLSDIVLWHSNSSHKTSIALWHSNSSHETSSDFVWWHPFILSMKRTYWQDTLEQLS